MKPKEKVEYMRVNVAGLSFKHMRREPIPVEALG
jgi:hypothetical protein